MTKRIGGKRDEIERRERLATAAAHALPQGSGGYSLTAATAEPLRRRLRGVWTVAEHSVEGESFISRFASRAIKGAVLEDVVYRADYEFKDHLCLKRVEIVGRARSEEGISDYRYRLSMALSWELDAPGLLSIQPELGYQCTEFDGQTIAVKELDSPTESSIAAFRFDGDSLILEEDTDFKRLERLP